MPLLLIRHGRAGHRDSWAGDDRRRPLDATGRTQAAELVGKLAAYPIGRILSSPYDRCVQTVEPLAADRGLAIEEREALGEERQYDDGVALVRGLLGERLKKGETLVVDERGRVVERLRV